MSARENSDAVTITERERMRTLKAVSWRGRVAKGNCMGKGLYVGCQHVRLYDVPFTSIKHLGVPSFE